MTQLNLKEPAPQIDHTVFQRYLDSKTGNRVTIQPLPYMMKEECEPYNYNWLYLWTLGCVHTKFYVLNPLTEHKNYFNVPGTPMYGNSRHGVREGLLFLSKRQPQTSGDIDAIYESQAGTQALEIYNEILAFSKAEKMPSPPPLEKPVPLPPVPKVEDPPKDIPTVPKPKAAWKSTLLLWLGGLSVPLFFIKLFIPGAWGQIIDAVLKLLHLIAGA